MLREWRKEAGLTQRELAELIGVERHAIGSVESGRRSLHSGTAVKMMDVLDISKKQVVPGTLNIWDEEIDTEGWDDGLSPDAPRQTLQWWRERRSLTLSELAALGNFSRTHLYEVEQGNTSRTVPATRRRLARALRVRPDKLILPGDDVTPSNERSLESILRAELRGARRALRKSYDFLREDPNIAFRALEKRDALLKDVEREIRGT